MSGAGRSVIRSALFALAVALAPVGATAQDAPALLAEAERLLRDVANAPAELRQAGFAEAAVLIDRIVEEHPGSDEAVGILLGEPVAGLDLGEIRRLAASPPAVAPFASGGTPAAPALTAPPLPDAPPVAPAAELRESEPVAGPPAALSGAPPASADFDPAPAAARPAPEYAPAPAPAATTPPAAALSEPAAAPAPERSPSPEVSPAEREAALRLGLRARQDIQRRLGLIGFDPGGVDGVLGPRARDAIARWQGSRGFATTGYLDAESLVALRRQSARAHARWETRAARAPAPRPGPPLSNPTGRFVDERGCLREADGSVVRGFRFDCR